MDFDPKDRQVFCYHDGEQQVYGDPLELHRGLVAKLIDPAKVVGAINQADAAQGDLNTCFNAWAALEELIGASREVFKLQPFDRKTGQGATDAQAIAVVKHFWTWLDEKKNVPA